MARAPFRIGEVEVQPGKRQTIELPFGQLYTHTPLDLPLEVIHGRKQGPTLLVCAAIHGDEINGVEIIRRLMARKDVNRIRGTLVVAPIVNILGFISRTRYLPDRRDLNRCFPGSSHGSAAGRLAHLFINEVVNQCSHLVDLHTGAVHRGNFPQIRTNMENEANAELAVAFGAPVILSSEEREGSLRGYCTDRGIPVVTYEGGEALRFDDKAIIAGVRGILNILRHLDMLGNKASPKGKSASRPVPLIARDSRWLRAEIDGILRTVVKLGSQVSKGQLIGFISDPCGTKDMKVISPVDGIVIGRSNLPLVYEGEAFFNIATFQKSDKAGAVIKRFESDIWAGDHVEEDTLGL